MPSVLFTSPILADTTRLLRDWFEGNGFTAIEATCPNPHRPPRLAILRSWEEMTGPMLQASLSAAAFCEDLGVKTVNPARSHLTMNNKLASNHLFESAGLPCPETYTTPPAGVSVVKPVLGAKGRGVRFCRDRQEALQYLSDSKDEPMLCQQFIEAATVRVLASRRRALYAYSKNPEPGEVVASISQGAQAERIDPIPRPLAELAVQAVQVVGGILCGVDLLLPPGKPPVLLEINPSFRLPSEIEGSVETVAQAMLLD